jgi:hypothetical protein
MFCPQCGNPLQSTDNFCSKCSARVVGTLPLEKSSSTRYGSAGDKFGIIMGIVIMLTAVYTSNLLNFLLATAIFGNSFASLKIKSKPIQQLTGIISLIISAVAIINLIKLM